MCPPIPCITRTDVMDHYPTFCFIPNSSYKNNKTPIYRKDKKHFKFDGYCNNVSKNLYCFFNKFIDIEKSTLNKHALFAPIIKLFCKDYKFKLKP